MISKHSYVGCLIIFGVAGCALSTRDSIKNVGLGMSTEDVQAIVGAPTAQAEQDPYQAWRYEYQVLSKGDCGDEYNVNPTPCVYGCEYKTVWFTDNVVRSMTTFRVESVKECGLGSVPINWDYMPKYANRPND